MSKNEKNLITVNDIEYNVEDMTDEQKALLNHVNDLGRKMDNARFNLDQLAVGRDALLHVWLTLWKTQKKLKLKKRKL